MKEGVYRVNVSKQVFAGGRFPFTRLYLVHNDKYKTFVEKALPAALVFPLNSTTKNHLVKLDNQNYKYPQRVFGLERGGPSNKGQVYRLLSDFDESWWVIVPMLPRRKIPLLEQARTFYRVKNSEGPEANTNLKPVLLPDVMHSIPNHSIRDNIKYNGRLYVRGYWYPSVCKACPMNLIRLQGSCCIGGQLCSSFLARQNYTVFEEVIHGYKEENLEP